MAPTSKERLDEHDGRLEQIEQKLGLQAPSPKSIIRQFFEHIWHGLVQHWKIAIPPIALCLTVFGWFVGALYKQHLDHEKESWNRDVDDRTRRVLNEPNGVIQTVHDIQQTVNATKTKLDTLEPFIEDVVRHQFENVKDLQTSALEKRLPAIQHLLTVAKDQEIKTDTPTLNTLANKLSTVDANASNFWPTAAEFISYRSQVLVPDLKGLLRQDLPKCSDLEPNVTKYGVQRPNGQRDIVDAFYADCRITLDSPEEAERIIPKFSDRDYRLTFRHCHVFWNGGEIPLLAPASHKTAFEEGLLIYELTGRFLIFENSLLTFRLSSTPPVGGQELTKQLLPQNGPVLSFPYPRKSAKRS